MLLLCGQPMSLIQKLILKTKQCCEPVEQILLLCGQRCSWQGRDYDVLLTEYLYKRENKIK